MSRILFTICRGSFVSVGTFTERICASNSVFIDRSLKLCTGSVCQRPGWISLQCGAARVPSLTVDCARKLSSSSRLCSDNYSDKKTDYPSAGQTDHGNRDSSTDNETTNTDGSGSVEDLGDRSDITAKHQPVSDADVDRELIRYDYEEFELLPDEEIHVTETPKKELPVRLERGTSGVFNVEEIVDLLRSENGRDICVIRVPEELKYVSYLVLVTGRSTRHIRAMAAFVKWMYKRKRTATDPASVKIEGELTDDWLAIDLGNIAVHLFLRETRRAYDIESLWTVGPDHDDLSHESELEAMSSQLHEEFSFDAELERLRKLRGYGDGDGNSVDTNEENISTASMESTGDWHQQSNT